jgi:hypothetical protein
VVAQLAVQLAFEPVTVAKTPPPPHRTPSSAEAESAAIEASGGAESSIHT